jgi:hypothetical protein
MPCPAIPHRLAGGVLVSQDGKHYCHFGQPKLCRLRKLRRTAATRRSPETVAVVWILASLLVLKCLRYRCGIWKRP